jgi:carbon-monoxide dehydrogenase medium subunit
MIKDFIYLRPSEVEEALLLLSKYRDECKIICGGQSLLILMRHGLIAPKYLMDIKFLKELNYIYYDPQKGLKIGAGTTHRAIEKSEIIRERFRVLREMESKLASIQTRNWGTIGGNICHGDPASDPAVVLIALKASLKMANSNGERSMAVEDFCLNYFETALNEDEMLLEIQVPIPPTRTAAVFEKFTIIENDMGIVSVAVSVKLNNDRVSCQEARVVLGGVAPTPKRATKAEETLVGKRFHDGLLEQAGQMAYEQAEPISDIHASEEYRRHLIKVLTKRTVRKAWEQAKISA